VQVIGIGVLIGLVIVAAVWLVADIRAALNKEAK